MVECAPWDPWGQPPASHEALLGPSYRDEFLFWCLWLEMALGGPCGRKQHLNLERAMDVQCQCEQTGHDLVGTSAG